MFTPFPRASAALRHCAILRIGFICLGASTIAPVLSAQAQPPAAPPPFTAQQSAIFEYHAALPMKMPTDLAIARDGRLFIVDGVNDRILTFAPDGSFLHELRRFGDQTLSHPISIDIDAQDRLWIADTGHARLLIADDSAHLLQTIPVPPSPDGAPADPTGLAVRSDGKLVWIVDNHHHRLIRFDTVAQTQTIIGRPGDSLGQLQFPFMAALTPSGRILVSDVLNSRISAFEDNGDVLPTYGAYGVEPGQLYRPKGLALDQRENLWLSDSTLGVVQVFAKDGAFLDVLRDPQARPLRFDFPVGLAFDHQGALYVVELTADRVRKFTLTPGPQPHAAREPRRQTPQVVSSQPRSCTLCHLEWVAPLNKNQPTELCSPPPNPSNDPYVSRSETCLGCHDGSIIDSRRRVWLEHGHRTGILPPETMKIPPALPLNEGKLSCRTCHSAHSAGQFGADLKTTVFLRVDNSASQLCVSCHQDKTRGPGVGTHPTGGMPWAVPNALVEAGARLAPNPRELTCQVCHTPHGSSYDHLLVMGTSSNQLCLTCHDQMRPGMFRDGPHTEHPLSPILNPEQRAAIDQLATRVGPDGQLICLSCHKLHHGKGDHFMLADDLTEGRFCLACHSEKKAMLGLEHDLRFRFPEERNRLGMTPDSGGPCSACHLFHRYARSPEISDIDPGGGKCITCHQPGRPAGDCPPNPLQHPRLACTACHNPHAPAGVAAMLRAQPGRPESDACLQCHDQALVLEATAHSDDRLAQSGFQSSACAPCHKTHADDEEVFDRLMWPRIFQLSAAPPTTKQTPPATLAAKTPRAHENKSPGDCRDCHADGAPAPPPAIAAHPDAYMLNLVPPDQRGYMPLLDKSGRPAAEGQISCITCHLPHGRPNADLPALLAMQPNQRRAVKPLLRPFEAPNLCTTCHGADGLRRFLYFHDPNRRTGLPWTSNLISSQ